MSEPMYMGGDPIALSNTVTSNSVMEVECGWDPCRYAVEVPTSEEYSHGTVTWYAEWKCPSCNEDNSTEGWYDPNDNN